LRRARTRRQSEWRSASNGRRAALMLVAAPLVVTAAVPACYAAALAMRLVAWAMRLATCWPVVLVVTPVLMLQLPTLLGSFLTWVLSEKVVYHKIAFGRIFLWPVRAQSVPLRASLPQLRRRIVQMAAAAPT
jgi:hypothetical protein